MGAVEGLWLLMKARCPRRGCARALEGHTWCGCV